MNRNTNQKSDPIRLHNEYIIFHDRPIRLHQLEKQSVSPEDLKAMTMSPGLRAKLPPKLDDDALIETAEDYLKQCNAIEHPAVTYEQSLIHVILPELIERLKDR